MTSRTRSSEQASLAISGIVALLLAILLVGAVRDRRHTFDKASSKIDNDITTSIK